MRLSNVRRNSERDGCRIGETRTRTAWLCARGFRATTPQKGSLMHVHRLGATFVAAVVAAVSLGACGGGDESITPTGPHYQYVYNKVLVPTDNAQQNQYGLDLNGDGTVDNAVGGALVQIKNLGFDLQAAIDRAVLSGRLIGLADIQTEDFSSSNAVGMQFFLGSDPQPAACNASEMVVCSAAKPAVCEGCGRHLTAGTFSIASSSPQHDAITGKIAGGTFNGGPGSLTLLISLGNAEPIRFDLVKARVKVSGMSEATVGTVSGSNVTGGFILAGIVTQDSVDKTILPGILAQLNSTLMTECTGGPPPCGCPADSTSKSILMTLDKSNNCTLEIEEVQAFAPLLLRSDLSHEGKPAYGAGVKVSGTKATFTVPGQ